MIVGTPGVDEGGGDGWGETPGVIVFIGEGIGVVDGKGVVVFVGMGEEYGAQ